MILFVYFKDFSSLTQIEKEISKLGLTSLSLTEKLISVKNIPHRCTRPLYVLLATEKIDQDFLNEVSS